MYGNVIFFFAVFKWNQASVIIFSVNGDFLYTFLNVIWIDYIDVVHCIAETAGQLEVAEIFRDTRIDGQSFVGRLYAQNSLGQIAEGPCSGSGQPAVLGLSVELGISTGYHL